MSRSISELCDLGLATFPLWTSEASSILGNTDLLWTRWSLMPFLLPAFWVQVNVADSWPSELYTYGCMCPFPDVFPPWEPRGAGAGGWLQQDRQSFEGAADLEGMCLSEIPYANIHQNPLTEIDTITYFNQTPTGWSLCMSKVGTPVQPSECGPRQYSPLETYALNIQSHLSIPSFPVVGTWPCSHLPGPSIGERGNVFHNRKGLCSPHLQFLYCALMKPCFFWVFNSFHLLCLDNSLTIIRYN